jgi:arylformamidase
MMRRNFNTTVLALLAATAVDLMSDEAQAADDEESSGTELEGRDDAGPFPLPPGASVERDLAYGGDPRQKLDVYHPANADKRAVIFMVHGGAWMRGRKDLWRVVKNKVAHWVGEGCVFVSTDYRMSPQADPVTQAHDVARALAFVQAHLASWGGDPNRLVVVGHSSGAHLVSLLTAEPEISSREGVKPWCATIALDSAAMNVEQVMRRQHFKFYDRVFGSDPGYWREASPTLRLTGKPAAPMLLVCSSRRMDSCPQARAFAARATQLGGRAEVLPVDLTHPEINDYLGAPGGYTSSVDAFLNSVGAL